MRLIRTSHGAEHLRGHRCASGHGVPVLQGRVLPRHVRFVPHANNRSVLQHGGFLPRVKVGFVSGHDFSRAVRRPIRIGALAPDKRYSAISGAKALIFLLSSAARLNRPLKKSKKQLPRGLKSARDDKNKGLRRGPEGPLYPSDASNRVFQQPLKSCPDTKLFTHKAQMLSTTTMWHILIPQCMTTILCGSPTDNWPLATDN
jgi:hypothetical protein